MLQDLDYNIFQAIAIVNTVMDGADANIAVILINDDGGKERIMWKGTHNGQ